MQKKMQPAAYLEWDNLPNRLTLMRLVMVPVIVVLLMLCQWKESAQDKGQLYGLLAAVFFILASVTDYLDGLIARKKNIITLFGSFLDPIADKFLVVSSLVMLLSLGRVADWIVIVLILREMYMMSLRLFALNEEIHIPVVSLGKWKTAMQMIAIPMLMINDQWGIFNWKLIGTLLIYISCLLSIISSTLYSFKLLDKLRNKFFTREHQG